MCFGSKFSWSWIFPMSFWSRMFLPYKIMGMKIMEAFLNSQERRITSPLLDELPITSQQNQIQEQIGIWEERQVSGDLWSLRYSLDLRLV